MYSLIFEQNANSYIFLMSTTVICNLQDILVCLLFKCGTFLSKVRCKEPSHPWVILSYTDVPNWEMNVQWLHHWTKMQNMTIWEIASCRKAEYATIGECQNQGRLIKAQITWNLLKKHNTVSSVRRGRIAQNLQNFDRLRAECTNMPQILQNCQDFF